MRKLNLDKLKGGFPVLSKNRGANMAEAAAFCFSMQGFEPGVIMQVEGDYQDQFEIIWTDTIDEEVKKTWQDWKEATKEGAMGISLIYFRDQIMLFKHPYIFLLLLLPLSNLLAQNEDKPSTIDPNKTLLKSIYFGGGSAYIDEDQLLELQEFIFSVENINRYEIIVNSFTDNIGSREYNQWLSQQRSAAVIDILWDLEIDIELILKADFGEDDPVYSNTTFEGKLHNRRVDVILRPLSF